MRLRGVGARVAGRVVACAALAAGIAGCGAPAAAPTVVPTIAPTAVPTVDPAVELAAEGRLLFEEKKGCAGCHGADGLGKTSVGSPSIRGKTEEQIRAALNRVQMMSFIRLTPAELRAIAAHLKQLEAQAKP